jgi:hypothetical protein
VVYSVCYTAREPSRAASQQRIMLSCESKVVGGSLYSSFASLHGDGLLAVRIRLSTLGMRLTGHRTITNRMEREKWNL